jgi:hypothetical protein
MALKIIIQPALPPFTFEKALPTTTTTTSTSRPIRGDSTLAPEQRQPIRIEQPTISDNRWPIRIVVNPETTYFREIIVPRLVKLKQNLYWTTRITMLSATYLAESWYRMWYLICREVESTIKPKDTKLDLPQNFIGRIFSIRFLVYRMQVWSYANKKNGGSDFPCTVQHYAWNLIDMFGANWRDSITRCLFFKGQSHEKVWDLGC